MTNPPLDHQYDIAILGSGPGGYVAAIRAAQLGFKTVVVEKEALGGTCLNWGCIPTKALLKSSEVHHCIQNASDFGISVQKVSIDVQQMVKRTRDVIAKFNTGIAHLLDKHNVKIIKGYGKINPAKNITVATQEGDVEVCSKHLIIATGATSRIMKGIEPDGNLIWSYKEAMIPDKLPKSIAIMGSGAIGVEFASFYSMLGVDVTIIEMQNRILVNEDAEIAALARQALNARGVKVMTDTGLKYVEKRKEGLDIFCDTPSGAVTIKADRLISAVGVVPNIEHIGLEHTNVVVERGCIKTNKYLQTAEQKIYAIGDVTSPPWLAHKASYDAVLCIESIAGITRPRVIKPRSIPRAIYCHPQIASIGLTEEQARVEHKEIKIGKAYLSGNGKAVAIGEPEGLVKLIFAEDTGELVGAHMIGAETSEMIQGLSLVINMEGTELDIINTVFPHPTISEAIHEAALNAYGKGIHQ
ncbi:dihydrolipoyl dehydrogenase [Rickettsiales endosymbiont of Peranema trichophorum]|uniref:dihydrolipoyl dehydrogenase n=1 Tax=Rickettsiales endosymbiont of Peranema trichophorum TaxID=2486577 RepID=UPI0010234D28|nr:dihydrolipoyl dehydrogenase [Rickettsiales endosymbiont of Peranema trichophorum]RZI46770.1 dihydrolipoyl dehydrogenase [Rickettsiales endosymbiont of Peranema trichophorum]